VKITSAEQRRLITEGALWANLLAQDLYSDLVLISDDAAQFKLLAFLHALCWVHMERHVARLIPLIADQHAAHEEVRDEIWNYYQRLKAYRESPTPQRRGRLEKDFDKLFMKKTGWPELDEELQKIHGKKSSYCWFSSTRKFRCTTTCRRTISGSTSRSGRSARGREATRADAAGIPFSA